MRPSLRHPLHPALAHFPLAFWIGASISDLIALGTGNPVWWTVSHHAAAAGNIAACAALALGLLELVLRRIPDEALSWVFVHAGLMAAALFCFLASQAWRKTVPPSTGALVAGFLGSAIVLAGGYCGGTLVYRFCVGVSCPPDVKS